MSYRIQTKIFQICSIIKKTFHDFRPRSNLPNPLGHPVVKKIAKKHNKKPAQVLVRFLHERNIVTIPKSETPSRIRSNIDVFDFSLDAADMKKLYALERGEEARVLDFKVSPV